MSWGFQPLLPAAQQQAGPVLSPVFTPDPAQLTIAKGVAGVDGACYVAGGGNSTGTAQSTILKLNTTLESIASMSATLATAVTYPFSTQSSTAAYFAGGANSSGTAVSTCRKLTFSSGTASTLGSSLPTAKYAHGSLQSDTKGFALGGYNTSGTALSSIAGLTFGTETWANQGTSLPAGMTDGVSVQGSTNGYVLGGYNGTGAVASAAKVVLSTVTTSTLSSILVAAGYPAAGLSSGTHGYAIGGNRSGITNEIDGIVFSTETQYNPSATFDEAGVLNVSNGQSPTNASAGFVVGGSDGDAPKTNVDKFTFASETVTYGVASMSSALTNHGCAKETDGSAPTGLFPTIAVAANTVIGVPAGAVGVNGRSITQGYLFGGNTDFAGKYKFSFATETRSTISGSITASSAARDTGVAGSAYGYAASNNGYLHRIQFAGETVSEIGAYFASAAQAPIGGAVASSTTALITRNGTYTNEGWTFSLASAGSSRRSTRTLTDLSLADGTPEARPGRALFTGFGSATTPITRLLLRYRQSPVAVPGSRQAVTVIRSAALYQEPHPTESSSSRFRPRRFQPYQQRLATPCTNPAAFQASRPGSALAGTTDQSVRQQSRSSTLQAKPQVLAGKQSAPIIRWPASRRRLKRHRLRRCKSVQQYRHPAASACFQDERRAL
jgi:hypothetical protein